MNGGPGASEMESSTGALIISLDFELYWGIRDLVGLERCRQRLAGTREVVPKILAAFGRHRIHATWATVGLLFCGDRAEALHAAPSRRPTYADPNLSPYPYLAALPDDDAPLHFAPDLVRRILDTPNQELASHTFSHYYCLEPGQSLEQLRGDLRAAQQIARKKFGVTLESLVFPRNQASAAVLGALGDAGFVAYRGTEAAWCYRPHSAREGSPLRRLVRLLDTYVDVTGPNSYPLLGDSSTPVNLPSSRFLRPFSRRLAVLEFLRLRRIVSAMESAARRGEVFHLWWHPENFGLHQEENLAFLDKVLEAFTKLRADHGMRSLTLAEAARERLGAKRDERRASPSSSPSTG